MSSSSFKNLPRHVQRELMRHVNRGPSPPPSPPTKVTGPISTVTANQAAASTTVSATSREQYLEEEAKAHLASHRALRHSRRGGLNQTLGASISLFVVASSFPLLAWWWIENLNERDDALTAAQTRRGAFMNSGSRDIGRDPDWDFDEHHHKHYKGYGHVEEVDEESNETADKKKKKGRSRMSQAMSPVDPQELDRYDANALVAAARGLPPQVSYQQDPK